MMPILPALYFIFLQVDNMQMRSYSTHQGLLLPMKVRFPILCDSFHSGVMAGLDLCTWTAGGVLNKYPYQPEWRVELAILWALLTSGGSLYIHIVFEIFFIERWGGGNYLSTVCLHLYFGLFHCILWLLCGGHSSPTVLLLTPRGKKSLKLLKLVFLLASLKMY